MKAAKPTSQIKRFVCLFGAHVSKSTPGFFFQTLSYGNKVVLDFYGKPEFAELGILRLMQKSGWNGVWVDSYRGGKFKTQFWPKDSVAIPLKWENLLERIWKKAGAWAG